MAGPEERSEPQGEPDVFRVLEGIDFKALAELQNEPGFPAFAEAVVADALRSDTVRELQALVELQQGDAPQTFDEMMDPRVGTALQRIEKWYLRVGDPKKTKQLLERIGVGRYQALLLKLVQAIDPEQVEKKKRKAYAGERNNYYLSDASFSTLLDMAVHQTGFNEKVHLLGALLQAAVITGGVALIPEKNAENLAPLLPLLGFLLLEMYIVLSQRYARARLAQVIDRKLEQSAEGAGFDLSSFKNRLGLRLPKP